MVYRNNQKLKTLINQLPSGLLADSTWLERRGYYQSIRNRYVNDGWLERPAHGVYRMPGGRLQWEHVVISMQSLMEFPVVAGGVTALHIHGYTHYVPFGDLPYVCLYGSRKPPGWLFKLPCWTRFRFHKTQRLFPDLPITPSPPDLYEWSADPSGAVENAVNTGTRDSRANDEAEFMAASFTRDYWGMRDWPMAVSTTERAMLESIDMLPKHEGAFDLVDKFMESVAGDEIDIDRMNTLLRRCGSIKTKRMFMWFAERNGFECLDAIDLDAINLGSGRRQIFKGGQLDTKYNITMPHETTYF